MAAIKIRGARTHNLQNIHLDLPKNKLLVITGLSGSGKSSLAFDTLYAEGQRRYVESLSAYARQFLQMMDKPDVDSIEGLSPAIAIEQKATNHNPRSTVGTVTEIHDYLRLLYARVGTPYCPTHRQALEAQTISQMVDTILQWPMTTKLMLLAPVVTNRKGQHTELFSTLQQQGFTRFRIRSGAKHKAEVYTTENLPELKKNEKHTIEVVIDRLKITEDIQRRLAESLETTLRIGLSRAIVINLDQDTETLFSSSFACPHCQYASPPLEPALFSFNNPLGACPECDGLGEIVCIDSVRMADPENSLVSDALESIFHPALFSAVKAELTQHQETKTCPTCSGTRLTETARTVTIGSKEQTRAIFEIGALSLGECLDYFQKLIFQGAKQKIAEKIVAEICARLSFLNNVGLNYLSLDRNTDTLSGGEAQRIRLASQIGSGLTGVLYVLDEPSIGLHQRDNARLIATLKHLRDLGNTVLVVEHDEDMIRASDHVVDMGPGAGFHGGKVIAQGTPQEIIRHPLSLTGSFLSGKAEIPLPTKRLRPKKYISIRAASGHNLQNVDVNIPIGLLTCVTGVSGSGKSTLINDTLFRAAAQKFYQSKETPADHRAIENLDKFDKVINVDQAPIGRTPRSNPATYTGLFSPIRDLFAQLPESKARGYALSRFSFNVKGGRCETCQGDGLLKVEMHLLPDVYVPCDVCHGQRYNRETLEITYRGKNIHQVLDMTVTEAHAFFNAIPRLQRKLQTLVDVGLSYIRLGQSATTLSGGEAQRVKLALELSKRDTGRTLYILDEPTTGLHFQDIKLLLAVLVKLRDQGNTIVIIEHNLDVIKTADWVIDLGPEGGQGGGKIIAFGAPETIAQHPQSFTGQYLKPLLLMKDKSKKIA